jgi:hypothetical protein
MLKLTIFHGSPRRADDTIKTVAPIAAKAAPTVCVMLLNFSP